VRSRPLQVAASAVLLFGLYLGAEIANVPVARGVVWAEVSDRMAQADRFMFRLAVRISAGPQTGEAPGSVGADGKAVAMAFFFSTVGTRWDLYDGESLGSSIVMPVEADSGIAINYHEETWSRIPQAADVLAGAVTSPVEDPETWVRRFLERERTELGRSAVDGIEVEGVEVIDPPTQFGPGNGSGLRMAGIGRLWVSVESGLPVRIELEQEGDSARVSWILDFRWGAQVEIDAFDATVPDGFTLTR
jgi:hypothetical protein